MKVLQIGDVDITSRRFSGHNLNIALRKRGIEAEQSVWWKYSGEKSNTEISNENPQREALRSYLTKLNTFYSANSLFYPFSYGLLFDKQFLASDVTHLHLIHNNFFDISHLPILSRVKPLVWTLHDLWPIHGHCVHPLDCNRWQTGCGDCPDLLRSFEIKQDTSALNWEYKKLTFSTCEMDLIVASQWMYDRIIQSGFFPKCDIHLINFGLDLSLFKPFSDRQTLRKRLGIPENNIVIAFRANNWIYKGFNAIKECLNRLESDIPISLIVFDEKGLVSDFSDRFQIIEVGWVDNEKNIVKLYNAADIFLMPSLAESFGMMAIECMACGKPVIVMDQTALPEIVKPEESGCLVVKQGDVAGLTQALEKLISDSALRNEIGLKARRVAQKYYDYSGYVEKTIHVYESAINRKKEDTRSQIIIKQLNKYNIDDSKPFPVFPLANVINIFPDSKLEIPDSGGISISDREFIVIKKIIAFERTKVIQFFIQKMVKPIARVFKKFKQY